MSSKKVLVIDVGNSTFAVGVARVTEQLSAATGLFEVLPSPGVFFKDLVTLIQQQLDHNQPDSHTTCEASGKTGDAAERWPFSDIDLLVVVTGGVYDERLQMLQGSCKLADITVEVISPGCYTPA